MRSVLVVLGTRPEAVKLAPVVHAARRLPDWRVRVCCTGQHRELVAPILPALDVVPDVRLGVMRHGQDLGALLGRLLSGLASVVRAERPDMIVAQGDTSTVLAAALTAQRFGLPLAHVEAGLRTGDFAAPFPEEGNRVLVGQIAALHLAPTRRAGHNLRREGVAADRIVVTGNTVVDAVRFVSRRLPADGSAPSSRLQRFGGERPIILVTGHRRESLGGGLDAVCSGLGELAQRYRHVDLVYPVHLNPAVQTAVRRRLSAHPNVALLPPLGYPELVWLMGRARFVITDSGGIQEEAPELGKPVLVTRAATERPEAVEQGSAVVVGYDTNALIEWAGRWLDDDAALAAAAPRVNPFGDGQAAARCVAAMRRFFGLGLADVTTATRASTLRLGRRLPVSALMASR